MEQDDLLCVPDGPWIVDGGLATSLESMGYELHPQLWSAGVFIEHPDAVERLLTYRRTPRQGVILVTSAIGQEGTSTVARNVATALSQGGSERVLLVDANLRTPIQHTAFDLDRSEGFSEVLQGTLSVASAINDDIGSGIALMTSGAPVKSPSQVLKATTVQGAIMALQTLYDWIILDCPPATIYPDAASLGTACGGAILVVRAESTRSEVAAEARGILEGTGTDVLGAVCMF